MNIYKPETEGALLLVHVQDDDGRSQVVCYTLDPKRATRVALRYNQNFPRRPYGPLVHIEEIVLDKTYDF